MASIVLPTLNLECSAEFWDDLVRKFSIENQYEDHLIAKDFLEMTASPGITVGNPALEDTLDFLKFRNRQLFAAALRKKYRQGMEFADDPDAATVFDKVYKTAEAVAMGVLKTQDYSIDMLICIEIYYWVVLQLLRKERGERMDGPNRGNQARLGDSLDLAGDEFLAIAHHFLIND